AASPAAQVVRRLRDRIPPERVAAMTQRPARITATVAAELKSAEEAPPGAAASTTVVTTSSIEHEPRSEPASPTRDAIPHLAIGDAPGFVEREPLFREETWERKANMWLQWERKSFSQIPGRPRR